MLEETEKTKLNTLINQIVKASKVSRTFHRRFTPPPSVLLGYDATDRRKVVKISYDIIDRKTLKIKSSTRNPSTDTHSFYLNLNNMLIAIFKDVSAFQMQYHENGMETTITCTLKDAKKRFTMDQVLGVSLASSHFLAHKTIRKAIFEPLLVRFCAINAAEPNAIQSALQYDADDDEDSALATAMATLQTEESAVATATLVPEGAVLRADAIMVEAYEIPQAPTVVVQAYASTKGKAKAQSSGVEGVYQKKPSSHAKSGSSSSLVNYFPKDSTFDQCLDLFGSYYGKLKHGDPEAENVIKMLLLQMNDIWNKNRDPTMQLTLANLDHIVNKVTVYHTLEVALKDVFFSKDRTYNLLPSQISQLVRPFLHLIRDESMKAYGIDFTREIMEAFKTCIPELASFYASAREEEKVIITFDSPRYYEELVVTMNFPHVEEEIQLTVAITQFGKMATFTANIGVQTTAQSFTMRDCIAAACNSQTAVIMNRTYGAQPALGFLVHSKQINTKGEDFHKRFLDKETLTSALGATIFELIRYTLETSKKEMDIAAATIEEMARTVHAAPPQPRRTYAGVLLDDRGEPVLGGPGF